MLFFFELGLFVLILLTLALGELVSRGLALGVWLVCTVVSLVGYFVARRSIVGSAARDALEEKWARTLLYTWRRTNVLLLVGAILVAVWYRFA